MFTYGKRTSGFDIHLVQLALLYESIEKREHEVIRLFVCRVHELPRMLGGTLGENRYLGHSLTKPLSLCQQEMN